MATFDGVTTDAGSGGSTFAVDSFTDTGGNTRVMPFSALAYGAIDSTYTVVSSSAGLPVAQQGTWTVDLGATDNAVLDAIAASLAGTLTVGSHAVTDGGSSLTVDAPVGTPVFVRLSDGSAAISTLPVSLASVTSHAVTNAGTFAVQAAQSGTWTVDLGATDNAVLDSILSALQGTLTVGSHAVTNAGTFAVQAAQSGAWNITNISGTVSLPTGAATAAKQPALGTAGTASADVITIQGVASMTAIQVADNGSSLTVDNGGTFVVQPRPETSGGLTIFRTIDLDESEEEVKASAGQVYGWYFFNASTSIRYLKFYNATAANVTVGTTTPVMTIPLPAASSGGVGANVMGALGIAFDTAITVAATTALADNDTGAPGANEVILNLWYK